MKFGFMNGWLYDMKPLYETTINCQLRILMLAERLELGNFPVMSVNTDGIVTKVELRRKDEYTSICEEWAHELNYGLEYTQYKKYVRTSVNDYMAITIDNKIKTKGDFNVSYDRFFNLDEEFSESDFTDDIDLAKGYGMPVVVKAINAYYTKGVPIKTFITEHNDIYDFCMTQNIGSDFQPQYHTIKDGILHVENLQKTIRFYASKTGGALIKHNKDDGRDISVLAHRYVTVFNNYVHKDNMADYNIDYLFYITEAMKIVNSVSLVKTKDMKKYTGSMFDDIEDTP